jgi:hypothetical protein
MSTDFSIQCSCGTLRGVVRGAAASAENRVVCYCDDCQSFAHFLQRADEVLDENGGTDIFQISPARLEITQGSDQLACIRLTSGGMLRWHTTCCRTPIGNTLARPVAFVGLIRTCIDQGAEGRSPDAALGPIRGRVQARFAKGDLGGVKAHNRFAVRMMLPLLRMMLVGRLRGDHKRGPFFDPANDAPRATPRVLTADELREVEAARDAG